MLVNFNNISNDSRIWLYASPVKLNNDQKNHITNFLSIHLKNWEAHKVPLTSAVTILENYFIVIALDEDINNASGCSIDTLQHKIQELEEYLSISLTNRLNIYCLLDGIIECVPSSKLAVIANKETLFYDLTIQKKIELDTYLKPIKDGWCSRLVK
jgi:phosphopantetheine adenylyltransferase